MASSDLDERFEEHLDDEQHVFKAPSSWILRNGISIVFCFVITLLAVSAIVKFPERIQLRVTIATEQPPIRIMSKVDGELTSFFIHENSMVKPGEVLAAIRSSASYDNVRELEALLDSISHGQKVQHFPNFALGMLQNSYSELTVSWNDLISFYTESTFSQQMASLKTQIEKLNELSSALEKRKELAEKQSEISKKDFVRNKSLHDGGYISDVDFEKNEINFLNFGKEIENLNIEILSNQLKTFQLTNERNELNREYKEQNRIKTLRVEEGINKVRADISAWKELYLITAPIEGKVVFTGIRDARQFVRANSEVLTIIPRSSQGNIIGRGILTGFGSGKVKPGLKTIIQLDGYPYQEYGSVIGKVRSVAEVPSNDGYIVEIALPNQLTTTYNNKLNLKQEMQGDAFVITNNRSLLRKFIDKLISPFNNQ